MKSPLLGLRLAALAMLGLMAASALAKVTVTVNVKDGATIAGIVDFEVLVETDQLVTQVEYYVNDDLRDSDDSTPYAFKLDTVSEKEGPLVVRFLAITDKGERGEKKLRLTVDNAAGKSADFHVERARELLVNGKWDEAMSAGRVALKIQPKYPPAMLVLARASMGKGQMDLAQKYAEDVLEIEKENSDALNLLAGVQLRRAFTTFNRGGDRDETLTLIRGALKGAIEARTRLLVGTMDRLGSVTDENRMRVVDAALAAHRYSTVIRELEGRFRANSTDPTVANRLAYAYLRSGRSREAAQTLDQHFRGGKQDALGWALMAIVRQTRGDQDGSLEAEREAQLSDNGSLAVRSSRAFLALSRGRSGVLSQIAGDLAKDEGSRSEVLYYLSTVNYLIGEFEPARDQFERSLLAEPANYDMLIERGNQAIAVAARTDINAADQFYQLRVARVFFDSALIARPESFEALTGLAIVSTLENKLPEAESLAQAAIKAGPEYAAARYALAATYNRMQKLDLSQRFTTEAARLDRTNLEGATIPTPQNAWAYFRRFGRTPLLPL